MIEQFRCRVGRTVNVALLDPFNPAYRQRVEAVASPIRPVVENWERFRDLTHHLPEDLRDEAENVSLDPDLHRPQHLAYMIRKLAEMLSAEQIDELHRQPFIRQARDLARQAFARGNRMCLEDWGRAERAMKIVYDGFSAIQNRLDLGMLPFSGTGIEINDNLSGEKRLCGVSRQGELLFSL